MAEINKLKELQEELKQKKDLEEQLFDKAENLKDKELHLKNINELHIKMGAIQYRINKLKGIEEEDYIQPPFDYVVRDGEYSFGGIFHDEETDYSLRDEEC